VVRETAAHASSVIVRNVAATTVQPTSLLVAIATTEGRVTRALEWSGHMVNDIEVFPPTHAVKPDPVGLVKYMSVRQVYLALQHRIAHFGQ
jgi:hypothetical protein